MTRSMHSTLSMAVLAALSALALTTPSFAADKSATDSKTKRGTVDAPKTGLPLAANPVVQKPAAAPTTPTAPSTAPTLVAAQFSVTPIKALAIAPLKLDGLNIGAGMDCYGSVNWGDGTQYDGKLGANGLWQTLNQKSYAKAGQYTLTITPKNHNGLVCMTNRPGNAPIKFDITVAPPAPLPPSTITELSVGHTRNTNERTISIQWNNNGHPTSVCNFIVHFGDGTDSPEMVLWPQKNSVQLTHKYAASAGAYSVIITPTQSDYDSCSLGPNAGPKTFTLP